MSAATVVAGFALVSDIFGAFGDADYVYADYYADRPRAVDFLGAYLLVISGIALATFVIVRTEELSTAWASAARAFAVLHAAIVVVVACALLTVPASRWYGDVFSDTGQLEGDDSILAAFAFVLYFLGGAISAGCTMVTLSQAVAAPGWFMWVSRVVAALMLPALFLFVPILSLPLWLIAAGIESWRAGSPNTPIR